MKKFLGLVLFGLVLCQPVMAKGKSKSNLIKKVMTTVNHIPRNQLIQSLPKLQQNLCTALAIYKESRGLTDYEQYLVVQTIINREEKHNLNVCQVLAQPGQFPWVRSLNKRWKPEESEAWAHAQYMALAARYTNIFKKPKCSYEYFSVELFPSHRRNLLCASHLAGHYYYALRN